MRRIVLGVLACSMALGACTAGPAGPARPASPDRVSPDDAVKATGSRAAALAFVQAYAAATGSDVTALDASVGTRRLHSWVHWLGVQNGEFPGSITGSADPGQAGPADPFSVSSVPGSETILREVTLLATVTFAFDPTRGDPVSVDRSLDGPMRLVLDPSDGTWKVLDFTRDGIPLSAAFEIVTGGTRTTEAFRVTIDAFLSAPYWEFFIIASGPRSFGLTAATSRLISPHGGHVAAKTVTSSLRRIPAGAATEGIVTFPPQPDAGGLTLELTLVNAGRPIAVRFPLGDLIHPIPLAPSSPSPSPSG